MPELPEVETVVRTLEVQINDRIIKDVEVFWPKLIANVSSEEFRERLRDQQFVSFGRRGKFLVFRLTRDTLIAHLRMEGKFYVYPQQTEPLKHTHIVFKLDRGELHYNDVRKFGRFYLYGPDEPLKALEELGYEPFDGELNSEYLKQYCRNSHMPLKSQLLDQGMIAGIGNIYANEICFEVGMHPCHSASLLSREKWDEVIAATKKILGEAIKQGGTTIRSYTSSLGVTGLFQQQLHVHTKKDEPCEVCGEKIIKIAVNGRGTYFCPHCQKEKPVLAAVTGNIGSGKSTVMQKLQEMGYPTISCDAVNAGLLEKEDTRRKLAAILACDWQEVNKPLIRERIFADKTLRKEVESCLHELIWKEIQTFYESQTSRIVFVEVPLLFETDWYRRFELCILVRTSREALYQRLQRDRGMSEEAISTVLASQLSDEEKTGKADMVINNDGTLAKLEQSVEKAVHNIVKLLPEEV